MTTQNKSNCNYSSVTKFMKNYGLDNDAEYYAGGGFEIIENKKGGIEIFFLGGGKIDNIINMYPDVNSHSGYSSEQLPLSTEVISPRIKDTYATKFDKGRIALFSMHNNRIDYIYENVNTEKERWSSVKTINFPPYIKEEMIYDIQVNHLELDDGGEGIIINLIKNDGYDKNDDYNKIVLSVDKIEDNEPKVEPNIIDNKWLYDERYSECSNVISTGNTIRTAAIEFIKYDKKHQEKSFSYVKYLWKKGDITRKDYDGQDGKFDSDITNIDGLISIDDGKKRRTYCKVSTVNSHQYIISLNVEDDKVSISKIFSDQSINLDTKKNQIINFSASLDEQKNTHLFIKYGNDTEMYGKGALYHMMENNKSPSGWGDPVLINQSVMSYIPLSTTSGNINVFFVDNVVDHNFFIRSMWSLENNQWINSNITPGKPEVIKEFTSYSTELYVKDKAGFPLVNEPVEISSSTQTQLVVNGDIYFIDEDEKISIETNMRGSFTIVQPAENLGVAALSFTLPHRDFSPVAIRQYADIKNRLSKLTGQELKNAKDSEGNPLLDNISSDAADHIVQSVRRCMEIADAAPKLRSTLKKEPHVGKYTTETLRQLETLQVSKQYQPWMLDLSKNTPIYRELSEEELQEKVANLFSLSEWFSSIGDFILNVKNEVFKIIDITTRALSDGVEVIFKFFENGVEKIFNAVVKSVQDALNIASSIFDYIKLTTEKIVEWIGFVFDWDDILRTKEAVSHVLSLQKGFFIGATEKARHAVDKGLKDIKDGINNSFDKIIDQYKDKNVGYYYYQIESFKNKNSKLSENMNSVFSNNFLLDHVLNYSVNNDFESSLNVNQLQFAVNYGDESIENWKNQATKYSNGFSNSDAVRSLGEKLAKYGDIDAILSMTMKDVLEIFKLLINAAMKGITELFDSTMKVVEIIIGKYSDLIEIPLDIPFVSMFFKFITKNEKNPSINDLISLIIAMPVTILSKIILNKKLFPDKDSVLQFKKEINLTRLLDIINSKDNNSTGLIKHIGEVQSKKNTKADEPYIIALKIISAVCTALSGMIEGLRVAAFMFEEAYPSDRLTTIKTYIKYFSALISTINVICSAFYSFKDPFSAILLVFNCIRSVILICFIMVEISSPYVDDEMILSLNVIFGLIIFMFSLILGLFSKQNWTDIVLGCLSGLWLSLGVVALIKLPFPWPVFGVSAQYITGMSAFAIKVYKLAPDELCT
ncbi:hypothetical protein PSI15_04085 [Xenorhabdus sp. PR6a]|uniref:hypothetical protein n=1 Tax=Xenorhabdus sp. PR6a TaxID=3025877 RepID=UPI0023589D90|nr:hypothetical protein [Xenorhabdus sp. PR6a]MDC9580755.1 hypothetical protein [Xenorhabdus sp. PR6a]